MMTAGRTTVRFPAADLGGPKPDEARFLGLTEAQHVLEVTRIAYAKDDLPVETVINVFPSQQWRLSYEWAAE
jgi:GntR family transcriptional regulator